MKIMHINVRSIRKNGTELMAVLDKLKIDIVSINETFLRRRLSYDVPGFQMFRRDRPSRGGGGVMILVRNCIQAVQQELNGYGNEVVACRVYLGSDQLLFASVYKPPDVALDVNLLTLLSSSQNVIIAGDFNAKHPALGSRGINRDGTELVGVIDDLGLVLASDGLPTHTAVDGSMDQLDLIIASQDAAAKINSVEIGEDIGSDHLPVVVEVGLQTESEDVREWFDLRRANWRRYRERLDSGLETLSGVDVSGDPLEERSSRLAEAMMAAANESIPKARPRDMRTWILTPQIRDVIRSRQRARRNWQRTRDPAFKREYNDLQRLRDHLIAEQKKLSWERFCEKLERDFRTDTRAFWCGVKQVQEGNRGKHLKMRPLKNGNQDIITDAKEKAELFADRLKAAFQTQTGPSFNDEVFAEVTDFVQGKQETFEPLSQVQPEEDDPLVKITAEDVGNVAKTLPMKAPGLDGVLNAFIRNGTPMLYQCLAVLFNLSLSLGRLPRAWKEARIAMIPKPGRDHSSVKGYRPLSMLSCITRLLEKIIAYRLHGWLEKRSMIPAHQSGFRSRRSVCDNVFRLAHEIQKGFSIGHSTVAVFLDIEGAFDSVWHDGLRRKLYAHGLPVRLVRWVSDFLRHRVGIVEIDGKQSRKFGMRAGVPQGSPLSPILFTLYTADIPSGNKLASFADDIAVWETSSRVGTAKNRVQHVLDEIVSWCSSWRLKLCPEKCVSVTFTRRLALAPAEPTINGLPVAVKSSAKFLGVTFDSKLNWNAHLNDVKNNATKRVNGLRLLSSYRLGLTTRTLLSVYKAYVRSVLSYCATAWLTTCETRLVELERIQNSALRACLRAHRRSPIVAMQNQAGISSLREHLKSEAAEYMLRSLNSNPLIGEYVGNWRGLKEIYRGTCLAVLSEEVPIGPWNRPQPDGTVRFRQ